ncbi:MAG: MFS transporter [Actinomycetota bacterium]
MRAETARYGSASGRWIISATVLGSGIAFLDGTVVSVALPAIEEELGGGLSGLQWTVDAYLVTLGALLLLGGSLGDIYGRRKMFVLGLGGFAAASALCGLAPSIGALIAARAIQGIAAALLTPGSLAIIQASFAPEDRSRAIGAWSGLSGVSTALGPFLGGYLVDAISWRWVFIINLPLAAAAILIAIRYVPETKDEEGSQRPDAPGAVAAALALGGVLYALIEGPVRGWADGQVLFAIVLGAIGTVTFFRVEMHSEHPMLPLSVFRSRQFSGANVTTFVLYGALSGALLLLVPQLQTVMDYSALEAGAALIPLTVLLLLLSPAAGRIAQRSGPRLPMTVGPLLAGLGLGLLILVKPGSGYANSVLPGIMVFGLGMALTVAPLTAAVLAAVESRRAGVASGVNNAVARIASLLAIALLPLAAGLSNVGDDPERFTEGFHRAMLISAALCFVGGANSWLTIRRLAPHAPHGAPAPDVPASLGRVDG